MRAVDLDEQVREAVPGKIIGRAEALGRAAFLSRAGPEEKPTYHVTYLEYPDTPDSGSSLVVRYEAGHENEADARFDFAAFFYPLMNLLRTTGGRAPLGPQELIEAKVVSHEQARLIERLASYGIQVEESADADDAAFWKTVECTLREEIDQKIPEPDLREMLKSLQRLSEQS